ncbi:MAG: hypothetical protein ACM31L_13275 [Actinomycetota bacterium]
MTGVLGACQSGPLPPLDDPRNAGDGSGLLVVGISLIGRDIGLGERLATRNIGKRCFQDYGVVRFDTKTRRTLALPTQWCERCTMGSPMFDTSRDACGGVSYQAYRLPPGDYAFGYLLYDNVVTRLVDFDTLAFTGYTNTNSLKRDISAKGRVPAGVPTVALGEGEVVYAGDLVFDNSAGATGWTVRTTAEGARASLGEGGAKMIVRPWTRSGKLAE